MTDRLFVEKKNGYCDYPTTSNNSFTCFSITSGYLTESTHLKVRKSSHLGTLN